MTLHGKRHLAAGLAALVVFAVMVIALQWRIAPLTDARFLPQTAIAGYTQEQLSLFALALHSSGEGGLYRNILRLDLLFMGLWGLWVVTAFPKRRVLGWALAGAVLVFDLGENILLEQALGWAMGRVTPTGWTLYPPLHDASDVAIVTQAKLLLYPLVTVPLLIRDFRLRHR